jgi:hypothetical protein
VTKKNIGKLKNIFKIIPGIGWMINFIANPVQARIICGTTKQNKKPINL